MVKVPEKKTKKKIMKVPTGLVKPTSTLRKFTESSGLTIGHIGQQSSGKSIAALQYGYLNLEYEDKLLAGGFTNIVEALKDHTIPEVKKIVRINSEWDEEQLIRPVEKSLVGELMPHDITKYEEYRIDIPTKNVLLTLEGLSDDAENYELIEKSFQTYMDVFEYYAVNKEPTTAVIVDSMSLFKYLIDLKADVVWALQSKGQSDEKMKGINGMKWSLRNQYNRKALTLLRAIKGWTVATFREVRNSDWVVKSYGAPPTKYIWTEDTAFQFDMMYHFTKDPLTNMLLVEAMPEYCRYIYRGPDQDLYNNFPINMGSRLGIFPAIEGVIKQIKDDAGSISW